MTRLIAFVFVSAMASSAIAQDTSYWLRKRDGWFWYRDPPPSAAKSLPKPAVPKQQPELTEFESMQKKLEDLKRVAVMNPTDSNLLAYMRYQRYVMNKSEIFAERWQRLVWTVPELDYGLTGRPTNSLAINVYDEQLQARQVQTIRALSSTHGLLFVFRSDCPYCHRFAPILKRFEQEFGMLVFPVSLDGKGLPEYPHPQPDNGTAARLNATAVPALYQAGFALLDLGLGDLIERIATLAQEKAL